MNFNEDSDKGYFLEVDVQHPEKVFNLHKNLSFWAERLKIENVEKLVANSHGKKYVIRKKKYRTSIK